ncbi:heat shock related 70kda protein (hsp 70 family) [Vairimorpha apis BRL 01]|uniref:Heat shock related 70kda protein (Hsp 70 family) n=1 Tax=Vairimorpha apis BRL 01 TaxID=1037528 RepID=T0KXH6_9MICR|nr:heat shock related 70kda protein (hsp 70 family) [Vairimorpha apis BRL 01]
MSDQPNNTSNAIGIDLGTTYSCCGAYINGKVEIVTNPDGDRTTPSVVAFSEGNTIVVGNAAKSMFTSDPRSVVFDAKRMIGRGFDDENIQKCISKWPFTVVRYNFKTKKEESAPAPGSQKIIDNIAIKIERDGKTEYYAPIEISARVLTYMKKAAEARLGTKVEAAVVTVPAYFEEPQKDRTKEAATIAGFNPDKVRLLAEPTAAAIAYGIGKSEGSSAADTKETVLVFDLGGGTFDVSVLEFEYSKEDGAVGIAQATDGDTFLGGVDFDNLLMNHAISEFLKKNPGVKESDIKENSNLRLRAEVNRVKALLSSATNSTIQVPCYHGTTDLNVQITRTRFEYLCDPLFKKCLERVKGCLLLAENLKGVNYSKDGSKLLLTPELEKHLESAKRNITKVIPVGGSSRIPKIKSMLCDYFGQSKVVEPVNPDEAVAVGAAYQAASIFSDVISESKGLLLIDCCPLDLSIETAGGVATVLIERNSSIPTKKTETFTTYSDNQTAVTINVYEGNRPMVADNNLIGSFNLDGILPAPKGTPKINVTFDVDNNGVLHITAEDQATSKSAALTVSNTQSRLTDEDIQRMKQTAAEHEKADEALKNKITKKNSFESLLNTMKSTVESNEQMPQDKKQDFLDKLKPFEDWFYGLDGNNFEEDELVQKETELRDLIKELSGGAGMPGQ